MNTTELIRPPAAERPTFGQMITEIVPLVGAVAGFGPPVIALAGPWLLLALMLSAPFACLLTLLAAMFVAATVVVAITAAIVVAPYLLIGRLRSLRARRAFSGHRATQLVPVGPRRVAA
jgi:hypothetical protein